jgi:ubiquinone/menaquinone biosynthesis C-methylase UbiE
MRNDAVSRRFPVAAVLAMVVPLLAGPATVAQHGHDSDRDHAHDAHDATVSHRFDDVERWVRRFDDPERDAWQRPDEVVRFLELPEDAVVADLGAGTGYFSVRLARAVGPGGRVYALDIESALVEHMRERAVEEELPWMEARLAQADDPGLPEGSVDRILIVDTWHHIDDRVRYAGKLARALAPGGEVVVVDFREGDLPVGPPAGHKLSETHVRGEFAKAGWSLVRSSDALPYQYVLAFRPPS